MGSSLRYTFLRQLSFVSERESKTPARERDVLCLLQGERNPRGRGMLLLPNQKAGCVWICPGRLSPTPRGRAVPEPGGTLGHGSAPEAEALSS